MHHSHMIQGRYTATGRASCPARLVRTSHCRADVWKRHAQTPAGVPQADRRDLSAVTAQPLKRSRSGSHRRRRRFVSSGHSASLPNRCFTGGRYTPADAASSGQPRRGRFSTARSGAPSRLRHSGAHRQVPRHARLVVVDGRASGYFTTQSDGPASVKARMAGVYWRADPEDMSRPRLRRAYRPGYDNFTFFPFHLAVVTAARSARASMPAITPS